MIEKIISGGQTGADRAALGFAIDHGIPHGGWCPRNRKAEDGKIDDHNHLTETPDADYAQRTEWNVRDAGATVVFTIASKPCGGSERTLEFASQCEKPCLHLSFSRDGEGVVEKFHRFFDGKSIKILNVAGSRASEEPEIGGFVRYVLEAIVS